LSIQKVLNNAFVVGVTNVVNRLINLVTLALMARILGVDGFGSYNTAMVLIVIASTISSAGLSPYIIRELNNKHNSFGDKVVSFSLAIRLILSIVSIIAVFVGSLFFFQNIESIIKILCPLIIITQLITTVENINHGLHKFTRQLVISIISSAILLLLVLGVFYFDLEESMFYWSVLLSQFLSALLAIALTPNYFSRSVFRVFSIREMSMSIIQLRETYGALFLVAIFTILYYKIDILMLSYMKDDVVVGHYAAAYRVFEYILYAPAIIGTAILPVVSQMEKDRLKLSLILCRAEVILILPVIVLTVIYSDWIIKAIFGEAFNGGYVLYLLAYGIVFYVMNSIVGQLLYAYGAYKKFVIISLSAFLINFVLNYILIPNYGGEGAAIATVVSVFVSSVFHLVYISSYTKSNQPTKLFCLVMIIGFTVTFVSYQFNSVFVSLCVLGILSYFFRIIGKEDLGAIKRVLDSKMRGFRNVN